jgi:hypothetical protein
MVSLPERYILQYFLIVGFGEWIPLCSLEAVGGCR